MMAAPEHEEPFLALLGYAVLAIAAQRGTADELNTGLATLVARGLAA